MPVPGLAVLLGAIGGAVLSHFDTATLIALGLILIAFWFYKSAFFPK